MAKAGVIGSGSWGTALARVLSKNGHEVTLWSRREEESLMLIWNKQYGKKIFLYLQRHPRPSAAWQKKWRRMWQRDSLLWMCPRELRRAR